MKIAIMQPYFLPYIGYFQLINAVDHFIIYDEIKYTKKGWINRNRILQNGKDTYISLPLKKASDYLAVNQRTLADSWLEDRHKMVNKIQCAYINAPFFKEIMPLVKQIILSDYTNLFDLIYKSLTLLLDYLSITTQLTISSTLATENSLKAEDKVIAICKTVGATTYINPIGGLELYSKRNFKNNSIQLQFLKTNDFQYLQNNKNFTPWLSIVDVLMFNGLLETKNIINQKYSII